LHERNKSTRTVLFIKAGTYKEEFGVPADRTNLKLMDEPSGQLEPGD